MGYCRDTTKSRSIISPFIHRHVLLTGALHCQGVTATGLMCPIYRYHRKWRATSGKISRAFPKQVSDRIDPCLAPCRKGWRLNQFTIVRIGSCVCVCCHGERARRRSTLQSEMVQVNVCQDLGLYWSDKEWGRPLPMTCLSALPATSPVDSSIGRAPHQPLWWLVRQDWKGRLREKNPSNHLSNGGTFF